MNYTFETLIKEKNIKYDDRWKPLQINIIERLFVNGCLKDIPENIRKNIAYNIQYLEYLSFQYDELTLNGAITKSLIKNYIINGVSIIEAIFYWIIKSNGLESKTDRELLLSTTSNPVKFNENSVIIESKIYKKVVLRETEMSFDTMLKKVEAKKLLDVNHNIYPYLKKYRNLRNRVHLQTGENILDTDWWSFENIDYLLIRYILYVILSDNKIRIINRDKNVLYFFELDDEEMGKLKRYFKAKGL